MSRARIGWVLLTVSHGSRSRYRSQQYVIRGANCLTEARQFFDRFPRATPALVISLDSRTHWGETWTYTRLTHGTEPAKGSVDS